MEFMSHAEDDHRKEKFGTSLETLTKICTHAEIKRERERGRERRKCKKNQHA